MESRDMRADLQAFTCGGRVLQAGQRGREHVQRCAHRADLKQRLLCGPPRDAAHARGGSVCRHSRPQCSCTH